MVKLLVSTHSRVLLFDTETRTSDILHFGDGIYYGLAYPWVVTRGGGSECLTNLIKNQRVPLPSVFTHDAIRDGSRILIADCDGGGIVEVSTENMKVSRHVKCFSKKHHVNTIAVHKGEVWALLHNLGPSMLVKVNMDTGRWTDARSNVGTQSHGLVWYERSEGTRDFLILDSYNGALIHGDRTIWKSSERCFLKGLCVEGQVAYFGVSAITERSNRGSPNLQCEVAAVDLETGELLWRESLQTCGLLNAIQVL
jgi:hypothetical protein